VRICEDSRDNFIRNLESRDIYRDILHSSRARSNDRTNGKMS